MMVDFLIVLVWESVTVWLSALMLAGEYPIFSHLGTDSTGPR